MKSTSAFGGIILTLPCRDNNKNMLYKSMETNNPCLTQIQYEKSLENRDTFRKISFLNINNYEQYDCKT